MKHSTYTKYDKLRLEILESLQNATRGLEKIHAEIDTYPEEIQLLIRKQAEEFIEEIQQRMEGTYYDSRWG